MMVAIVLIFTFLVFCFKFAITKPNNFPPGPSWKPFVGSLLNLKKALNDTGYQHAAFSQLSKEWKTTILGLKLGNELVVIIEDFPTIEYILSNKEFDQRPNHFFAKLRNMGTNKGITFSEGPEWVAQRKFLTRYFNTISKNSLDHHITEGIENLIKLIDSSSQVNLMDLLPHTMINILWSVVAGKRLSSSTLKKNQLLNIMAKRNKAFDISGGLLSHCPWLRFIIPEITGYNLIKRMNTELKAFLMQTIKEHQSAWEDDNNFDFVYNYIRQNQMNNRFNPYLTDEDLFFVLLDLFIGGFSTTTFTLQFLFLMLILHQDVQNKIHNVLDETFHENYLIQYQDRYKTPYIEAVIKEVQRYRHVAPIFGPRRTLQTTKLASYTIPKNTTILMNMYPTWMSKEIWDDPEIFRPERFLSSTGKFCSKSEFIPFGSGRRRCPGDSLAQRSLFLITCGILRRYKVLPVDTNNLPSIQPIPGLMMSPQPYQCKFEKRH